MSGDDGIDIVLAAIAHRATGKSVSQMSVTEADMTLTMARDIYALVAAFAGERIVQAIEDEANRPTLPFMSAFDAMNHAAIIARNSP